MRQPGLTEDACANCNWPEADHNPITAACPDYHSLNPINGWLDTRYRRKQLVLTESVMTHMLADIDQIVTEWEMNPTQKSTENWFKMLRHAIDGLDYLQ